MKVILLSKTIQLYPYNRNTQNFTTWNALSKYFESVYIVVESDENKHYYEQCGNIHVFWIKKNMQYNKIYFAVKSYYIAYKLIKQKFIDVINIGEPINVGIVAIILKIVLKKPLIVQIQGQLLNLPRTTYPLHKILMSRVTTWLVCTFADRIRAVSSEIGKSLINNGIPAKKIHIITSRCDATIFFKSNYTNDRKKIRTKLMFSDDDIVLIYAGRFIKTKDIESIILAVKLIKKKFSNIKLLLVGDGPMRSKLITLTQANGLNNIVVFYGKVKYSFMPNILAVGDIFISSSLDEGLPRSILEAMSMELPVVTTKVGGIIDVIQDMHNGIFINIHSPYDINQKVSMLINNSLLRHKISTNARLSVIEKFSFEKCIDKLALLHFGINQKKKEKYAQ